MQPPESNQHTAVNSRQTLQGTDMDIKELALKIAEEMGGNLYTLMDRCEDFATRLIAAYCEWQEPVVRVIDGGGELHLPKLQWVSANVSLETPIGSDLFLAPPLPAIPDGMVMVDKPSIRAARMALDENDLAHCAYLLDELIAAGEVK